jgi:glycosyltransferase involved in cell wall biosynthesis
MPDLSVVIIGRNEGERLIRCLNSLQVITDAVGTVETIYVDSASQDGSPDAARALGANVLAVQPERPCAAIGRNAGWRVARAPFVLFLDGDTELQPGFVEAALEALRNPSVAVIWGHRRESHPERSIYNRVLDLDWIYPPGPSDFCGGDAVMRRQVLEDVGGFAENLIAGEEPELCQRMRAKGYVIEHIDHPMTLHDLAMTRWSAYWRRAVRAGYAYADVSERLKHAEFPLWHDDAKRNWIQTSIYVVLLLLAFAVSAVAGSIWPLLVALAVLLALALRSAYKARWKTRDPGTLFLFGVHCHLQQIPITVGQIKYWWDRCRGRHGLLIEYK